VKRIQLAALAITILAVPSSVGYAQQINQDKYIVANSINYGKVSALASEFGITYSLDTANKRFLLEDRKGTRVIIPLDNLHYTVSGKDYVAQVEVRNTGGEFWVSVKDFSNAFNLAASYYRNTQRVVPEDKPKSDQTKAVLGEAKYYDKTWGNTEPYLIRKYGRQEHVTQPITEKPVYDQTKTNPTVGDKT
jgi:hypothetical protein